MTKGASFLLEYWDDFPILTMTHHKLEYHNPELYRLNKLGLSGDVFRSE